MGGSSTGAAADADYDHLDQITSETHIRHYLSSLSTAEDLLNPAVHTESFLRERQVTKLQGLVNAMNQRRAAIRAYTNRCEVREAKIAKVARC